MSNSKKEAKLEYMKFSACPRQDANDSHNQAKRVKVREKADDQAELQARKKFEEENGDKSDKQKGK